MNAQVIAALIDALVQFLWQGAAAAGVLAAAIFLFRPASARSRYMLACLALAAMLASFVATLAWHWPRSEPRETRAFGAYQDISAPPLWRRGPVHILDSRPEPVQWIAPVWFLGVLILSLRSIAGWTVVLRLKRSGTFAAPEAWQEKLAELSRRLRVSRPTTLLESCVADAPLVIGFLKPVILIPAQLLTGFSAEQLECILIHELAHIRRHDYFVNLLQTLIENLLFYHPAVWWVSGVIRAERENCCDDIVAAHGGARAFAEALVELEQRRWTAREAGLAANGGQLRNRVQRLLNIHTSRAWRALFFFASLLPVSFAIAASIARAQNAATVPPIPAPPAPRPPQLTLIAQAARTMPAVPGTRPPGILPQVQQTTPYEKWLNEEVYYIITPAERRAFTALTTDAERADFIENFWLKRDPTPDTVPNEYREEYYRRILYSDQNFGATGMPGWKTDRGMIYIRYGPPQERDEHPSGGQYERPIEEGGGQTLTLPFEVWRYRYIPGVGNDVRIEFVDSSGKGEYHMTADPSEKDALVYVPGAGLTLYEQIGLAEKSERFTRTDGTRLGTGAMPLPASMDQFGRLEQFANLQKPPRPTVPAEDAIENIIFRGLQRIPEYAARNAIGTQTGDRYDKDALDRDIQALRNSQAFAAVAWTVQRGRTGWIITVSVTERR